MKSGGSGLPPRTGQEKVPEAVQQGHARNRLDAFHAKEIQAALAKVQLKEEALQQALQKAEVEEEEVRRAAAAVEQAEKDVVALAKQQLAPYLSKYS